LSTLLEALGEAGERVPAVVEGRASSHSGLPDPLLRSGLALAGATHSEDLDEALEDDGLLTAYEATTLQLEGTELVVLSACDSMRGVVRSGEGVIGLERALRAAGARNILATLWSVDDVIARELMQAVYGSWLESGDLRAAVRESQLRLRRRYQLPVLWGGFVLIGA
jgi:CHAT domain-containing protein